MQINSANRLNQIFSESYETVMADDTGIICCC